MSDDQNNLVHTGLEEIGIFTADEISELKKYHIKTVGGLLNATKGLTFLSILESFADAEEKLKKLRDLVGEELLERFQHPETDRPRGLILPEEEKSDEE
jgi:hypothetical protein